MKKTNKSNAANTAGRPAMARKKTSKSKAAVIVIAGITLAILIFGILIGVIASRDIDYLGDNLDKYVYISEDDYKNFPVSLQLDEIGDKDVERQIMSLLCKNRDESPRFNGAYVKVPISVGDEAYIYYRGYTVDENGRQTDISNACNISDDEPYALTIGSLGFIPGFEEGLIGLGTDRFADIEKHEAGKVLANDVIYLTYKAILPDGRTESFTARRIDLGCEYLDELYGTGFCAFFTEGENGYGGRNAERIIGTKITDRDEEGKQREEFLFQIEGVGTALYYDMQVEFATRTESEEAFTVDVYFPQSYQAENLRGVHAKFDVFVKYVISYNAPEFDDKFVKETLNVSEDTLSAFEGENLTDKYRAKIRADLIAENEELKRTLIEEAMWEQYNRCATVKKYPEREVKKYYNNLCSELEKSYSSYASYYASIDEFACAYYSLDKYADWREHVKALAESAVKEKLVFYYVVRKENLVPTGDEYDALYVAALDEYLTYYKENMYKTDLLNCKTEKEREALIEKIKKDIMDYYGDEYFKEEVIYTYALERLLQFAKAE